MNVPHTTDLLQLKENFAKVQDKQKLRVLPFILKSDNPVDLLAANRGGMSVDLGALGVFTPLYLARKSIKGKSNSRMAGVFSLTRLKPKVWAIITSASSVVLDYLAAHTLQKVQPRTSFIFLSNIEFKAILRDLVTIAGEDGDIDVERHSEYNRAQSSVNFLRRRRPYTSVLSEVEEKNAALRSLTGELSSPDRELLRFSLTNLSTCTYRTGDLSLFFNSIVFPVAELGERKEKLFADRERVGTKLKPLEIVFKTTALESKSANSDLIRAVSSIQRSAVAVFHSNPYIHLIYTDLTDGSSLTVFSSSTQTLKIIPSIRASVSSLMRLYQGIAEGFADCDIHESKAPAWKIEDVFGAPA